ncbi:MAG: efflux RND transporter permease subunit [Hylemonella sp.]|nr:efflux RND transporter permease subunit [Hylemonella sp.]
MQLPEIAIRRPVFATVLSLLVLLIGAVSFTKLPVREYPKIDEPVVTVNVRYAGASAEVVESQVAKPLEDSIAGIDAVDVITSISRAEQAQITVRFRLEKDADAAAAEVRDRTARVRNKLPQAIEEPVIAKVEADAFPVIWLAFSSDTLNALQINELVNRVVKPRLQTVSGAADVRIFGERKFAMRVWLDPDRLAAYKLTTQDAEDAIRRSNLEVPAGRIESRQREFSVTSNTDLRSPAQFGEIVIKTVNGFPVKLRDVARIEEGAAEERTSVRLNGRPAISAGVIRQATANPLVLSQGVREMLPKLKADLPPGISIDVANDNSIFIDRSVKNVYKTIAEAVVLVALVIFVFLRTVRASIIPIVTIPVSLVGTFALMALAGFTVNTLTLLALVLAIGLVVDDAIIVVENVNRHLEEGLKPFPAAVQAARELGGPIIAMTVVLIAVYIPIGFQSGLTGALFTEFAFTLVGAVTISAVVALTLSPMMCSRMLKPHSATDRGWEARLIRGIDRVFDRLRRGYSRWLKGSLDYLPVTATFAVLVLGSIFFLYAATNSELAPQEDQGIVITFATSAPNATIDQRLIYSREIYNIGAGHPETDHIFQLDVPGQSIAGYVLKPWDRRTLTSNQLQPVIQGQLAGIAGAQVVAFQPPPLPGSNGLPIQFVINTTGPFEPLNDVAQKFLQEALATGRFIFLNTDLKIDSPQATVVIDRDKASHLGLKMSDIGGALGSMLGGGYVNYFALDGRSYKVIPQVQQRSRLNVDQVLDYHIRTADGSSVPLSTVAKIVTKAIPQSLNHFQQLNSATIQGVAFPGVSQAEALETLKELAARTLPQGYSVDYGGASRQYMQETGGFVVTFAFALIIIYLSLAALFESFRDPLIILFSVPMSIAGALVFLMALSTVGVMGATLNIYTQVGLVTLMGLISKHGILIVEVANELQQAGKSRREAILEAAAIRLRPILMTTAAMVLGVVPLILATGAGALSRFSMGLVIASGLAVGTLFTLFVVPAVYVMLAADHSKKRETGELADAPSGD